MPDSVWDLKARSPLWADSERSKPFATKGIAFSPEGRFLLVAMWNGEVIIRASVNGVVANRFRADQSLIAMAISNDGRFLATACPGEPAKLWRSAMAATEDRTVPVASP